jgi:hypothetical protein
MRLTPIVVVFVVACGSSATGSSGGSSGSSGSSGAPPGPTPDPPGCADCGGCGFAGPVNADNVRVTNAGSDAGTPVVGLLLSKAGECQGSSKRFSTFTLGKDGFTVTDGQPAPGSVAQFDGTKYTWSDQDLVMTVETQDHGVQLTFTNKAGASGGRYVCSPSGEKTLCLPVP